MRDPRSWDLFRTFGLTPLIPKSFELIIQKTRPNVQIVELLIQKTPLIAVFTMQELKSNDELLADFGDAVADTVRSAAKSQVITNNLNEEVNTRKERYDGWCPQPNRDLEAGSGPSQECLGQGHGTCSQGHIQRTRQERHWLGISLICAALTISH